MTNRANLLNLWLWPLFGCVIGWQYIFEGLNDPIHTDALNTYLPAARALLDQGWAFLASPASFRVVPLGYAWPALWGADPVWIRWANCVLWAGCVFSAWRCAILLGGFRAGVVTVLLLTLHPELITYFPTELTEPIFLFGLFGWLWTLAEWLISRNESRGLQALSAFFLTLTLLSRPVLQLLVPLLLIGTLAVAWQLRRSHGATHLMTARLCRQMALTLAASLVLPALLVLKNGFYFGLWGLGTGSGTGLYLGTHPLFQGAEPAFLGFDYDVNDLVFMVGGDADHLSLAGDRAAKAVAFAHLSAMSLGEAMTFFARKLWWWMAHHPASLAAHGSVLRKVRLFEWLALVACASHMLWVAWRSGWSDLRRRIPAPGWPLALPTLVEGTAARQVVVLLLLFGFGGLLLAQLLPILYNSRYSSALLDPWLMLLTGFSVAYLAHPYQLRANLYRSRWHLSLMGRKIAANQRARVWPEALAIPALIVLAVMAFNTIRRYEVVAIDVSNMPPHRQRLTLAADADVSANGMTRQPDGQWLMTESPAALVIPVSAEQVAALKMEPPYNALWDIRLTIRSDRVRDCRTADVAYTRPAAAIPGHVSRLPLRPDSHPRRYAIHANKDLRPGEAGDLRIALHCPAGTTVQWHGARLLESLYVESAYRQRIRP